MEGGWATKRVIFMRFTLSYNQLKTDCCKMFHVNLMVTIKQKPTTDKEKGIRTINKMATDKSLQNSPIKRHTVTERINKTRLNYMFPTEIHVSSKDTS